MSKRAEARDGTPRPDSDHSEEEPFTMAENDVTRLGTADQPDVATTTIELLGPPLGVGLLLPISAIPGNKLRYEVTALATIVVNQNLSALPAADLELAKTFARQDKAPATRVAYRSDFFAFREWCAARGVDALPASPESVAGYLASEAEAGLAASTITRRCAAIRHAHKLADFEPPTNCEAVRATLRGIRRAVGTAPARKTPVLAETARAMALAAPAGLKGTRDRALLLLGFAGAFRRSELVALDVADLEETDDGFKITIRRSKTDQEGHGETIAIIRGGGTTCPVKAVKAWLQAAGISEGPLFRPVAKGGRVIAKRLTDKSVCDFVKAYAELVGLKAADFGAHSLRAGFLTSAARRGASVFKMRDVSRHKSMDVLQAYVRDADMFRDHAGAGLL
jgi:site-specific recombinase XerD